VTDRLLTAAATSFARECPGRIERPRAVSEGSDIRARRGWTLRSGQYRMFAGGLEQVVIAWRKLPLPFADCVKKH
jgi:hypothetical protein